VAFLTLERVMPNTTPSRRLFLRQVALGSTAAVAAVGLGGCDNDDSVAFPQGVASGDPLQDRVVLWTRAVPSDKSATAVTWELADDAEFSKIVTRGKSETDSSRDFTVKVDAQGLQPGRKYFYRFKSAGTTSPVGRTRTLPTGSVQQARLGVFSCANYPAGYFHVYAEAAKRDDLDVVVHLGDYIYEYGMGEYATEDAQALGRVPAPAGETVSLEAYRQRYAQYRGDKDLQALHAKVPFICVWDDHEVANDSYKDGAENHQAGEGDYVLRRAAAVKAWYEWLPVREPNPADPLRTYRRFEFGDLATLHMLDTRHVGRDKPLNYADYIDPVSGAFNAAAFGAAMTDPSRQMLGQAQGQWLQAGLAASGATWQILGQQVLMGKMYLPSPVLTPTPQNPSVGFVEYGVIATAFLTYQAIAGQLTAAGQPLTPANLLAAGMTAEQLGIVNDPVKQAVISAPYIPYNLDAWDGYAVARETVYATTRAMNKNLVVLSGDTHNAWANNLDDSQGQVVGVEFACSSVSSPGLEEYLPDVPPEVLGAGAMQLIGTLVYADTHRRGYSVVTLTPGEARADWYFVDSVKAKTYQMTLDRSLRVLPGAGNRRLISV
jgi:alkaline phosphatase D